MFGRDVDLWVAVGAFVLGLIVGWYVLFETVKDSGVNAVPPASIPDAWVQPTEFFIS